MRKDQSSSGMSPDKFLMCTYLCLESMVRRVIIWGYITLIKSMKGSFYCHDVSTEYYVFDDE